MKEFSGWGKSSSFCWLQSPYIFLIMLHSNAYTDSHFHSVSLPSFQIDQFMHPPSIKSLAQVLGTCRWQIHKSLSSSYGKQSPSICSNDFCCSLPHKLAHKQAKELVLGLFLNPTRCLKEISKRKDNYSILPGLLEGSIIIVNCRYWRIKVQRCFWVMQLLQNQLSPLACSSFVRLDLSAPSAMYTAADIIQYSVANLNTWDRTISYCFILKLIPLRVSANL